MITMIKYGYFVILNRFTLEICKYLYSEIYSSIQRVSDCPYWFFKVNVFKVVGQKWFWNPSEILVIICWKLRNTKGRDTSICHYSCLFLLPINLCSSDSYRLSGWIMNHWIFRTLEQMLSHLEKHLLMWVFLT